ncbi:MAG: anaerobic ribonucleoside-triphosphate reductase activating protein [Spirochaetes bacterium]|nr:anaerobic ribonucleoside-triphosphate reductase activating protein [Spirochaetota bacterium]
MVRFALEKTSLIDYPGFVSAVLFARGCNLRCPYCHNPELVEGPEPEGMESWEAILRFLEKRRSILQGVCISGGEPLLVPGLQDLIKDIQAIGYRVKVDTNGTKPEVFETLRPDYIAMDIKTAPEKYSLVGGRKETGTIVRESARLLIRLGLPHEFRITVAPEIFDLSDAREWATHLKGAMQVVLTGVRVHHVLDPDYGRRVTPYPYSFLQEVKDQFQQKGVPCRIRGETLGNPPNL